MGIKTIVPFGEVSSRWAWSLKLKSVKRGCCQSNIIPIAMIESSDAANIRDLDE